MLRITIDRDYEASWWVVTIHDGDYHKRIVHSMFIVDIQSLAYGISDILHHWDSELKEYKAEN